MAEDTHDATPVEDSVEVTVKGPDPEVWGANEDRPTSPGTLAGPGLDQIHNEGEESEVKGPSSEVWAKDDDGNYTGR